MAVISGSSQASELLEKYIPNIGTLVPCRYVLTELSDEKLQSIARLYAAAFADEPWNEYRVCSNRHFFGKNAKEVVCDKCQGALELAYPEETTVAYIREELGKPDAFLSTFETNDGIPYGAGWGFSCNEMDLSSKYRGKEMQLMAAQRINEYTRNGKIFYISEVMVDQEARGKGLGTSIAKQLLKQAHTLSLNVVMRTHGDSPMAKIAQSLGMGPVIKKGEDTEIFDRILCVLRVFSL